MFFARTHDKIATAETIALCVTDHPSPLRHAAAMRLPRRPSPLLLLLTLGLAVCASSESCAWKNKTLYIQGFVPANNEQYTSENIVPAANIAVNEINCNPNVLPDFHIELNFSDTMCNPSEATWQLIQAILSRPERPQPTRIMFLGGGCSLATEPLGALSGRFYNLTQISYGASSPTLSDRAMFPKFFRTIPSETQSNSARFALMNTFNWTKVATLHETQNIFSLTVGDFQEQYFKIYNSSAEDEDLVLRSFTDDPEIPLQQIKEKDIRIILGYFYEDKAIITLCQAYHMGLTTDAHVWMLPAWYSPNWWNTSVNGTTAEKTCTPDQMRQAVEYSLFLDSYNYGLDRNATTHSGISGEIFKQMYQDAIAEFATSNSNLANPNNDEEHAYGTFTYDAVYAMAYALEGAESDLQMYNLSLSNFEYTDNITVFGNSTISDVIFNRLNQTDFLGVSGQVKFDAMTGSRIGLNAIYQLRNKTESGDLELVRLAVHDPGDASDELFNYTLTFSVQPLWKGDGPPQDRRIPTNQYLDPSLIIACGVFTGLSILIAIAMLIFNIVTIQKPLIKDSAPFINMIIIVGCILMLIACFLLGVDSETPAVDVRNRDARYGAVCISRLWLLTIGFTLSFGALFGKTWQVYRVYTNPKLKKEPFKMWNFLIIIGIFLLIDVVYLSFWTGVFPFRRVEVPSVDLAADTIRIYEQCECDNFGYLIGALYVYKGLLVIFGLFLAYESRNVKYHYINDSRFVSISMYIVVILVGIGAPLSLVLAVHFFIDPAYALAVFMIILSCMACILIICVPKFVYMAKGLDTMVQENTHEEVTVSDGLQLGRSTVDQTDIKSAEDEVNNLENEVAEKDVELRALEDEEQQVEETKVNGPRMGSDGDSGVLVTGDETFFSTESTTNGEQRANNSTPTVSPTVDGSESTTL